jgi:hypothetical protein
MIVVDQLLLRDRGDFFISIIHPSLINREAVFQLLNRLTTFLGKVGLPFFILTTSYRLPPEPIGVDIYNSSDSFTNASLFESSCQFPIFIKSLIFHSQSDFRVASKYQLPRNVFSQSLPKGIRQ